MNVTELARQVKIPTARLLEILPELGFDIGRRAIKVDEKVAQQIIGKLNNQMLREKYLGNGQPTKMTAEQQMAEAKNVAKNKTTVVIGETVVVKELAEKMNLPVTRLILELMKNGVMASLNERIDFETAQIIGADFGFEVQKEEGSEKVDLIKEKERRAKIFADEKENLQPRPPVVVVMGHVDHGKTKLLDAIRETDVVATEAGGITQHIGAYQVTVPSLAMSSSEKKNEILRSAAGGIQDDRAQRTITFIDTPGHEAFSAMRSRGAAVADIAILVVAADDGIQPQTIEALSHIRSAELPLVVAINKIDKPEANIDKIKTELAEVGLTPEGWGGQTICVEISAKEKKNIDSLLETLLLVYEIEKDKIQGNPKRPAAGTIIESHIDKGLGPVATCIVQTGTLNTGDTVKIGDILSKVRSLRDWHGKEIKQAPPSTPAQIIGLKAVAQMGDILSEISDKKEIRQLQKLTEKNKYNVLRAAEPVKRAEKKEEEGETVKVKVSIILKADVLGSIEAIREALEKVQTKNVKVEIIKQGLGHITESEVEEAASLGAWLIGFHNAVEPAAEVLAANKGLEIHVFDIIYELIDFVREKVKELTKAEMVIKYLGKARVIKIFRTEKKAQIVGLRILDGKITAGVKANLVRAEKVAGEGKVVRIQCAKENVNEVVTDQECGMLIEGMNEIKDGDTLEFYQEEEKR